MPAMPTLLTDFDYILPPEMIAHTPAEPRDSCRLLVLDRATGACRHGVFRDIIENFCAGDVLVFNTSKVFPARLVFDRGEMFVLKMRDHEADVLLRPGKRFAVGDSIVFHDREFVVAQKFDDGIVTVTTSMSAAELLRFCETYGGVPLPPYIKNVDDQQSLSEQYQTVYAHAVGSVAAPTAGLHFTPELIEALRARGVICCNIVLHVGIGTFRPVQTEYIEDHVMHEEWVEISRAVADEIVQAKQEGRRVIAVGTTSVRALEAVAQKQGRVVPFSGEVNMFITPGYHFTVVDGMITNFHLPKSTLLMLVSAFAGREHVLAAYEEAKRKGYRFFSFGDAMLIV